MTSGGKVPAVGDPAPKIDTPTVASAGGDVKKIDTRLPPSDLHGKNFKDVVGKKPVILLFATPALCQTRVCGPVVDVAEQVKAMAAAGASRIGASAGVKIVQESKGAPATAGSIPGGY